MLDDTVSDEPILAIDSPNFGSTGVEPLDLAAIERLRSCIPPKGSLALAGAGLFNEALPAAGIFSFF
jgi:hypothetical protein